MNTAFLRTTLATVLLGSAGVCAGCASLSVMRLSVGDCTQLPESASSYTLYATSCSSAHSAEVFALLPAQGDEFPAPEELEAYAEKECSAAFPTYVGIPATESALDVVWLTPSEESWKRGDRMIACLAAANGTQTLTQSVKDSRF